MISWPNFLETVLDDFKNKGFIFSLIAEMKILTLANKTDMSYDFYIRQNMHAVEWKIMAMINKIKSLIKKLNRNWQHPSIKKFEHASI